MIVAALILGIFPSFGCFPAEPRPAEFLCVRGSADELESPVRWFLRAELEKMKALLEKSADPGRRKGERARE